MSLTKLRNRIITALFFIPCAFADGITLFAINIPMWMLTGVSPVSKESYIEWLFDLDENLETKKAKI